MQKNLIAYILTLFLVLILALNGQSKDINISYFYEQKNFQLERRDTTLLISLKGSVIKMGDKTFIAEKRKVFYSLEDYMVYDKYTIDKTVIIFNINPDTSEIVQVDYKNNGKIYYFRL